MCTKVKYVSCYLMFRACKTDFLRLVCLFCLISVSYTLDKPHYIIITYLKNLSIVFCKKYNNYDTKINISLFDNSI